jgi:trehalose 2-sulfotransferase
VPERRLTYVLVGVPRTGSSLLAQALTATGHLGRPEEYFWRWQEPDWAARFGLPGPDDSNYERYVAAVLDAGTTSNGVFGAKLFWAHLHDLLARTAHFAGLAESPAHERFRAIFGPTVRAVWVRRDCVRAAISLWRAETTGVWAECHDDLLPPVPDRLDVWQITWLHAQLHAAEIGWPQFLRSADIPYLNVTYDEIASDTVGVVRHVAAFLEVNVPESALDHAPTLRRQADATTERFVEQWIRETGGCATCQGPPL